jgi:hypothetical protein
MTRKEVVVDGHTLVAHSILPILPFEHTVNEQERVTVRENVHNSLDVLEGGEVLSLAETTT